MEENIDINLEGIRYGNVSVIRLKLGAPVSTEINL
jgi:hypothetical protein